MRGTNYIGMRSVFGLANKESIVSSKKNRLSKISFLYKDNEKLMYSFQL